MFWDMHTSPVSKAALEMLIYSPIGAEDVPKNRTNLTSRGTAQPNSLAIK